MLLWHCCGSLVVVVEDLAVEDLVVEEDKVTLKTCLARMLQVRRKNNNEKRKFKQDILFCLYLKSKWIGNEFEMQEGAVVWYGKAVFVEHRSCSLK